MWSRDSVHAQDASAHGHALSHNSCPTEQTPEQKLCYQQRTLCTMWTEEYLIVSLVAWKAYVHYVVVKNTPSLCGTHLGPAVGAPR